MEQFWVNTINLLKVKGISNHDLARRANIPYQTLVAWIKNDRCPRADEAYSIASILGTTVEFLVTGKPAPVTPKADIIVQFLERQIRDRETFMNSLSLRDISIAEP